MLKEKAVQYQLDKLSQERTVEKFAVEKDKIIEELQNRLFEQSDVLNAVINQMNSQKISQIKELLLE